MSNALFTNFTDSEFIGWWDGKKRVFPPGVSKLLPEYLARHFAKHLTNRELLEAKKPDGSLKYKDGEKMTSPKKPEEYPIFMEIFNQAFMPSDTDEIGERQDKLDTEIDLLNKNRSEKSDPTSAQNENNESEESFQGQPA